MHIPCGKLHEHQGKFWDDIQTVKAAESSLILQVFTRCLHGIFHLHLSQDALEFELGLKSELALELELELELEFAVSATALLTACVTMTMMQF